MKKLRLAIFLFAVIFTSCNNDYCGDCFTPPKSFKFELVDKISGENLFKNGTFEANQIEIINVSNNSSASFTFISENDINLIEINGIGFQTEIVNLKINIESSHIFNFYVDAVRKTEECCSFTAYKEVKISNAAFELDTQTGVYKILVE